MDYLPITVQLQNRQCLIVGGGSVAARKLRHLLKAGSAVTIVSAKFSDEVLALAAEHNLDIIHSWFKPEHVDGHYLVVAATNDRAANALISDSAKEKNIWVNVVDDLELSTFIMPAVIDRSPLLIAVSSSGVSPVLARKIREKIEWLLPNSLGRLLERLKTLRPLVKKNFEAFKHKREFSEWYIETAIADERQLEKEPEDVIQDFQTIKSRTGKVYVVGAGPGAADLLTVKALKVLQKADVVLYDALVSQEIIDCVRKDASLIHVGKRANRHFVTQDRTNQLLVEQAQLGLSVVRLKGGDPFIFGRGGEELQVLAENNIEFEVIPGITAASGCASYAGIPLTHRDYSQSLRFVTAHEKDEQSRVDWKSLANENQTLVFYMGLMRNQKITNSLIEHGLSPKTPVAIVENGTTEKQRVMLGDLDKLAEIVEIHAVKSPALIIVGKVTSLARELDWFPHGELIDSNVEGFYADAVDYKAAKHMSVAAS